MAVNIDPTWKLPERKYDMWKDGELPRILARRQRPADHKFRLRICEFPGNNESHRSTNRWIKKMMKFHWMVDKRISGLSFWDESSTPITMVRNRAVFAALTKDIDYLLMVDSDMNPDCEADGTEFWPSSWDFMYERRMKERKFIRETFPKFEGDETGVGYSKLDMATFRAFPPATIAAPYCGPSPNESVYVFGYDNYEENTPNFNFKLKQVSRDMAAMYTGIMEVPALATGMILYDLRLFRVLPPPWFYYEYGDEPHQCWIGSTEDVVQTRNAHFCGMPQYCNWDAWAGHIKLKTVTKPRPVGVSVIPDRLAEQMRTRRTENHKVVMIQRKDDEPLRPDRSDCDPEVMKRFIELRTKKTGETALPKKVK